MPKPPALTHPLAPDEIVALLIQIRCYCCSPLQKPLWDSLAWQKLNSAYGNYTSFKQEQEWLEHYLATHIKTVANTGPVFAKSHPELQSNVPLLVALNSQFEAAMVFTLDGGVVVQRRGSGFRIMHPTNGEKFCMTDDADKNYNYVSIFLMDNDINPAGECWNAILQETDLPWEWRSTPQQQAQSAYAQLTQTTSAAIAQVYELRKRFYADTPADRLFQSTFAQIEREIRSLHAGLMSMEDNMLIYAKTIPSQEDDQS